MTVWNHLATSLTYQDFWRFALGTLPLSSLSLHHACHHFDLVTCHFCLYSAIHFLWTLEQDKGWQCLGRCLPWLPTHWLKRGRGRSLGDSGSPGRSSESFLVYSQPRDLSASSSGPWLSERDLWLELMDHRSPPWLVPTLTVYDYFSHHFCLFCHWL